MLELVLENKPFLGEDTVILDDRVTVSLYINDSIVPSVLSQMILGADIYSILVGTLGYDVWADDKDPTDFPVTVKRLPLQGFSLKYSVWFQLVSLTDEQAEDLRFQFESYLRARYRLTSATLTVVR